MKTTNLAESICSQWPSHVRCETPPATDCIKRKHPQVDRPVSPPAYPQNPFSETLAPNSSHLSPAVNNVWHSMLDTRAYADMCKTMGVTIHHDPLDGTDEVDRTRRRQTMLVL